MIIKHFHFTPIDPPEDCKIREDRIGRDFFHVTCDMSRGVASFDLDSKEGFILKDNIPSLCVGKNLMEEEVIVLTPQGFVILKDSSIFKIEDDEE